MPATILHGGTIGNGSMPADVYALIDTATISGITGSEIASNTIENSNLKAITTASKVSGAAITALASIPSAAGNLPTANGAVTVTLPDQSSAPTTAANVGAVYCKAVSGASELFFREESDGDEVQITSGGALSSGKVLQIKYSQELTTDSTNTTIPLDNSKPQGGTDGKEVLNVAITPVSASSTIKVDVVVNLGHTQAGARVTAYLWRDATADALACAMQEITTVTGYQTISFTFYQASTNTNARTFRVSVGSSSSGTTNVNNCDTSNIYGNTLASSITATELVI